MVLPDSDGISRVPPYSGSTEGRQCFRLRDCYPLRFIFPDDSTNILFPLWCPTTPAEAGLGSSRFARRYSGNRVYFLFLRVLRCFSSPGLPPYALCIHALVTSKDAGFPHSDIFDSQLTYSSPKHFGVGSVLHRLLVPRHPPCALHHLIVMNL